MPHPTNTTSAPASTSGTLAVRPAAIISSEPACHPHASTITPVTIGADAGPKAIIPLPIAKNVPSRCEGTISKIAFIMSGIKIPVPTA